MATQLERMARMEEKVDGINDKLDKLIEGLDKRYAGKWVERITWLVLTVGVTYLVSSALLPAVK